MLEVFYGKLFNNCNTIFFGDSRDALQSYYSALYHINYDKLFFHTSGMNYPYGENIFFTGGHIPITGVVRFINNIFPIAGYTIGIINLFMLLSIVVCALSVYLIFREFSLPQYYSSVAAVCIAFLSPQMQRLGGTLSYEFCIPLYMYLLIKFYQNPSFKKSIGIGLYTFFCITCHFYFFVAFCFISFFYWTALFFSREKFFSSITFIVKHCFLQIILPFIILTGILSQTNTIDDRTQYPWGFFEYISSWTGVFFPFGKPYENIARIIYKPTGFLDWEGISYIGVVAVFSFFVLLILTVKKIVRKEFKQAVFVTDQKILNIFFWASMASLLYSFGYPFIWKKDFFIHYIGPLKELRALGRFSWLFFYTMNIVAFYNLYYWAKNKKNVLKFGLILVSLVAMFMDVYFYVNHQQDFLNASIQELTDKQNNSSQNKWLKSIDLTKYQAIIPLPYFHIGSENVWIDAQSDILKYVFIVSLKSGLPTTAVTLSRTSLSQTYKNICLILEPYKELDFLKDMPNKKPFLIMVQPNKINEREAHLLSKCTFLLQTPNYSIYELKYSTLQHYTDSLFIETKNEFLKIKTYPIDNYYSTDSVKNFVHYDYEDKPNSISYAGKGAYSGYINNYNVLYEGTLPTYKDSNYIFSFWMYNFTTDLYPRGTIEILLKDSTGKLYNSEYTAPFHLLKTLDANWALLEHEIKIRHASDKIKITLWNNDLAKDRKIILDEFWLKPLSTNIYEQTAEYIFKNNRYYKL